MRSVHPMIWGIASILLALPSFAQALTVSGTITDSNGDTVPGVLVEIRKPEFIGSSLLEFAETNAMGQYSSTNGITAGTKVFVRVKWQRRKRGHSTF